jgi:hypothetical protein
VNEYKIKNKKYAQYDQRTGLRNVYMLLLAQLLQLQTFAVHSEELQLVFYS